MAPIHHTIGAGFTHRRCDVRYLGRIRLRVKGNTMDHCRSRTFRFWSWTHEWLYVFTVSISCSWVYTIVEISSIILTNHISSFGNDQVANQQLHWDMEEYNSSLWVLRVVVPVESGLLAILRRWLKRPWSLCAFRRFPTMMTMQCPVSSRWSFRASAFWTVRFLYQIISDDGLRSPFRVWPPNTRVLKQLATTRRPLNSGVWSTRWRTMCSYFIHRITFTLWLTREKNSWFVSHNCWSLVCVQWVQIILQSRVCERYKRHARVRHCSYMGE